MYQSQVFIFDFFFFFLNQIYMYLNGPYQYLSERVNNYCSRVLRRVKVNLENHTDPVTRGNYSCYMT